MGFWNCSDNVGLLVLILDFGPVPTVWNYLFLYETLEMFRQCGIICFSFFYWTVELLRQCGIISLSMRLWNCSDIIGFSIGLWNCSESVTLFVFLLDFGTVPTV